MTRRDRQIHLEGLQELDQMATRIAPRVAHRLARATVHKIAGEVRKRMRQKAPKDDGTLRKSIHTQRRRGTPTEAVSDVRISHGQNVKHDAWYWRFVEFGTVLRAGQPFVQPTIDEMTPKIPQLYREEFGRRLERELEREHRKQQARAR